MKNALIVRGFQRGAHFLDESQGFGGSKATGLHRLAEVDAIDEFHDEEMKGPGVPEIEDVDDVGMIEAGEDAGFAGKAFLEGRVVVVVDVENLQGDLAIEPWLAGFVDGAHATNPYHLQDFKIGKMWRQVCDQRRRRAGAPARGTGGRRGPAEEAGRA